METFGVYVLFAPDVPDRIDAVPSTKTSKALDISTDEVEVVARDQPPMERACCPTRWTAKEELSLSLNKIICQKIQDWFIVIVLNGG